MSLFRKQPAADPFDQSDELISSALASVEEEIVEKNRQAQRDGAIKYDQRHRELNDLLDERDALIRPPIAPPLDAPEIEFMEPGL
jgi:hypothetical protein